MYLIQITGVTFHPAKIYVSDTENMLQKSNFI